MITSVEIKNFKSIDQSGIDLPLKPMTVLIGPNGSGKSSILQALALLKQSRNAGQIVYNGGTIRLVNYSTIIHNKIDKDTLEIAINGRLSDIQDYHFFPFNNFDYSHNVRIMGDMIEQHVTIKANDFKLDCFFDRNKQRETTFAMKQHEIGLRGSHVIGEPFVYLRGPNEFNEDLHLLNIAFSAEFNRIILVPALRGLDNPQYLLGNRPSEELTNASGVTQQGDTLTTTLAYRRELEDQISTIVSNVVQRRIRARLIPERAATIESNYNNLWIPITNEGMGSNPLLHLVAQLVIAPKNSLIMIEEPEIHLHPDAIARLAIELIKFVKTTNKRLLITTHSDHLIYPLLSSVESNGQLDLTKDDLAIFYIERDAAGNTTKKELNQENFNGALRNFFTNQNFIAHFLESIGL